MDGFPDAFETSGQIPFPEFLHRLLQLALEQEEGRPVSQFATEFLQRST